jgi:hypothetical protein
VLKTLSTFRLSAHVTPVPAGENLRDAARHCALGLCVNVTLAQRDRCIKPSFASANHTLHTKALKLVSRPSDPHKGYNVGSTRRRGAERMLHALEINLALWGMITCAVLNVAQYCEFVF